MQTFQIKLKVIYLIAAPTQQCNDQINANMKHSLLLIDGIQ